MTSLVCGTVCAGSDVGENRLATLLAARRSLARRVNNEAAEYRWKADRKNQSWLAYVRERDLGDSLRLYISLGVKIISTIIIF